MRGLFHKRPLPAGAAIFFLVVTCLAPASGAQMAVIELEHRPADEVIPVISPFLGPGDTLSGRGYLLFLNTTPENLTRIQSIIDHLDQASRQLAITVVQGENAVDRLSTVDISGSVTFGDGPTVVAGNQKIQPPDTVAIDAQSGRHTARSSDVQRVLVQNGATATIYVDLSAPVAMEGLTHKGMRYHQVQVYREMLTGVHVTPRLSGNRVTLEIEIQDDRPAGDDSGTIRSDCIQTQIQGRLDEWIEIGSILGTSNRQAAGLANRHSSRQSSHRQVFLKVTETRP